MPSLMITMMAVLCCILLLLFSSLTYTSELLSKTICNRVAPGLDRIALGVDVTRLDLFHDYNAGDDDGFTNRIVDYNCAEGKTWTSPFDGTVYQIPDEIDALVSMSSGVLISDSVIMKHNSELRKSMAIDAGIDASKGAFSASGSYKSSHTKIQQSEKTIAFSKAVVNIAQATFAPAKFIGNSSMSKYMRYMLEELPERLDNVSMSAYMNFFETYGTHFFHRSRFGGSLSKWFELDSDLLKQMDEESVKVEVKASFLSTLKAHGAYSGDVKSSDERFSKHEAHTEKYYGGQANLFNTDGYKTWWPTIASNPWLHSGTLVPITDLINDSEKKQELEKAFQVYMERAYLTELKETYAAFLANPSFSGSALLSNSVQELSEIISRSELPTAETAVTFETRLRDYVNSPQWFLNSEIAYQFDGLGEEHYRIGDIPAYTDPGLYRRPCRRLREGVASCSNGRIYFKITEEGQQVMNKYGVSFPITHSGYHCTGTAWRWWHVSSSYFCCFSRI